MGSRGVTEIGGITRAFWFFAFAGVAAVALLIALRGQAAASETPACASVDRFIPSFCITVPTTTVRRETTVPLVSLTSLRADVRVELTVPGYEAAALPARVDRAVERVEHDFGRSFIARPRILVFGTPQSFARGASDLFGYSADTAAYAAATYGGVFDRPTSTIALNWSSAGAARLGAAVEHELVHLMVREATAAHDIPVWFDEGVATLFEERAMGMTWTDEETMVGRGLAASGRVAFDDLATLSGWHAAYARTGRPLYAYAAHAVRAMAERGGWNAVVRLLEAVGAGERFADAYQRVSGESTAALERRFVTASARPELTASTARDANGNVGWTLFTGTAGAAVAVAIDGANGYRVTFTVTTDAFGIYRGSFGSTAAPGWYTVRAAGLAASLSTLR